MPIIDTQIPVLVTVPEAAEMLGLSRQRVHELVVCGGLPCRYVGRHPVLREEVVRQYEAAREHPGRPMT